MKSLEDLKKLREESIRRVDMRQVKDGIRVAVGMATCGITSGARPILAKFVEEVAKRDLGNVTVTQVGCIGECALEPIVEVFEENRNTIYCKVTPAMVEEIIEKHLINGQVIENYTIKAIKG